MERKLRITVGDKTREVTVQELGADGHPLPAAVAVAAIAAAPQRRPLDPKWSTIQRDTNERMSHMLPYLTRGSKVFQPADTVAVLNAVIRSGDRVNIEGNNQKQADFLSDCMCKLDPKQINHLHMVQSSVPLASHLKAFELGIAEKLDFAYAGPQGAAVAKAITLGKLKLGAIHTYLELFARYFIDLTPKVSLVCAYEADKDGNLYTGFNTEDTPLIVEATKFRGGIV